MSPDAPHDAVEEVSVLDANALRIASGTSWQPEQAPMYGMRMSIGDWDLMVHGNVFAGVDVQGSDRGAGAITSMNWLMMHVGRDVGRGRIAARRMLSLEPFTVAGGGYPLLLQTGETYGGKPLVDRQHPHDLLMELALLGQYPLTDGVAAELYVAPAGEPALGPTAFPHRASAINLPFAPLSHHWQDATHISFGVVTAGVFDRHLKLEGSWFNGREPDERRYDLDLRVPDSYSGRLSWAPRPDLVVQGSYGWLASPEALHPDEAVHRVTASATFTHWHDGHPGVDATLAWGRNASDGARPTDGLLLESNVALGRHWNTFGRLGHEVKSARDLVVASKVPDDRFQLHSATAGATYTAEVVRGWDAGIGLAGDLAVVPSALASTYGTRVPIGGMAFVQLRPKRMQEH